MKHFFSILFFCLLLASLSIKAQDALKDEIGHQLVTFQKHPLEYKNFILPGAIENKPVELREISKNKKLMLVTYFAAWCENSNHDAETVKYLLNKFGKRGLGVLGVCNYSEAKEVDEFIAKQKPPYPVVIESRDEKLRLETMHYKYRKLCGDERKWGTPFTLLVEVRQSQSAGEIIASDVWSANGEMNRKEAEKLIKNLLK